MKGYTVGSAEFKTDMMMVYKTCRLGEARH